MTLETNTNTTFELKRLYESLNNRNDIILAMSLTSAINPESFECLVVKALASAFKFSLQIFRGHSVNRQDCSGIRVVSFVGSDKGCKIKQLK